MTEESFDKMADHIVAVSRSSVRLLMDHGIDVAGYEHNYNEAIDILGRAHFGEDTWDEILEVLFTDDGTKTVDELKSELFPDNKNK